MDYTIGLNWFISSYSYLILSLDFTSFQNFLERPIASRDKPVINRDYHWQCKTPAYNLLQFVISFSINIEWNNIIDYLKVGINNTSSLDHCEPSNFSNVSPLCKSQFIKYFTSIL